MIMSNFIDETERHAELYGTFTPRQHLILEAVEDSRLNGSDNEEMYAILNTVGINKAEVDWLKRTGRFLPGI